MESTNSKVTDNWMPVRGLEAVPNMGHVFSTARMNDSYNCAQLALRNWRRKPTSEIRASVIEKTEEYLSQASRLKYYSTCQPFNICLPWAYAIAQEFIYYALVFVGFALALTAAITETYPRNTSKPNSVKAVDAAGAVIGFLLSVVVALSPKTEKYGYLVAGTTGFLHKVAKGYLTARDCCCPKSPVLTPIDKFNIFGPAVTKGISCIMILMSSFASPLPLTGPGELFHTCFARGSKYTRGLSQREKYILLNVLLMDPRQHDTSDV